MPKFRAFDVAVIGICAALYAAVGYLTAGVTFLGVAFLPAVVIPAVFAVLFGPWVGGFGGAIGIFIRDMLAIGIPALSLAAGVPPNFILFFLIGYLAHRNIDLKKTVIVLTAAGVALIVPTAIFLPQVESYTGLSSLELALVFSFTVVLSLAAIAVVSVRWKQWRSFAIGAVERKPQELACFRLLYGRSVHFFCLTSESLFLLLGFFRSSSGLSQLKSHLYCLLDRH